MAELGKGVTAGKLASNVQKRLTRAQEKVLQKLGKADETRDAAFEEMVSNFNKQTNEGTKLQKDLKAYLVSVKAMQDASRRLQDCLADMYEPEWFGKVELDAMAEEMIEKELDNNLEDTDTLWLDFHQSLTDKSLLTMDTYMAQFPDLKARIAKRDRKMVDFDSARHHFANLQKGKKKDEAKIAKPTALLEMAAPSWAQGLISAHQVAQTNLSYNQAEEELGRAQRIFEELNVELQDELPVLFDSRVGVYVETFQSMAKHQEKFHREMSKLSENLNDVMTKLEEQRALNEETNHSETAGSAPKRPGAPPPRPTLSPAPDHRGDSPLDDEPPTSTTPAPQPSGSWVDLLDWDAQLFQSVTPAPQAPSWNTWHESTDAELTQTTDQPQDWDQSQDYGQNLDCTNPDWDQVSHAYTEPQWDEEEQAVAANDSDGDLPPGFVYKVKAVHDYTATDGDELELKTGDMVLVMAFNNPDEQDDGWLLGVKESHWVQNKDLSAKGVFPENFTSKV